jgi:hypothetical protein
MRDLFGNKHNQISVHVNIYADEVQGKPCPYTNSVWNYIGLIVEDMENPLLDDIICERFMGNFDEHAEYYEKNNKIVHWSEIRIADTKNICKRWFEFILNPNKSRRKFYSYILGLNDSHLIREEFDKEDEFNSKYNRFFRSALLYALKTFFGGRKVIVENMFHEEGQQQHHLYFPWHVIYKLEIDKAISFNCDKIIFLPKDHKKDKRSNLIQLCDVILGVSTSIIHGIKKSKNSKYREELADLYINLFKRIIENPKNKNSRFEYFNRIITSFFPLERTTLDDIRRLKNQFYSKRTLYYLEQKSGQQRLML